MWLKLVKKLAAETGHELNTGDPYSGDHNFAKERGCGLFKGLTHPKPYEKYMRITRHPYELIRSARDWHRTRAKGEYRRGRLKDIVLRKDKFINVRSRRDFDRWIRRYRPCTQTTRYGDCLTKLGPHRALMLEIENMSRYIHLMAVWPGDGPHHLTVRLEDLVGDVDGTSRKLASFLHVDYAVVRDIARNVVREGLDPTNPKLTSRSPSSKYKWPKVFKAEHFAYAEHMIEDVWGDGTSGPSSRIPYERPDPERYLNNTEFEQYNSLSNAHIYGTYPSWNMKAAKRVIHSKNHDN